MRLINLIFVWSILLLSVHTNAQPSKIDSTKMITIRIDPENARGASVSQVFDEVNFIPLETTTESLFGKINQLKIIDGKFVIFDYDTKSILVFDKNGKYINKIDGNKIPKVDDDKASTNFYGFEIEKVNNENLIRIGTNKYIMYYTLNGTLVKKIPSKNFIRNEKKPILNTGYSYQLYWKDSTDKDSTNYQIAVFKENKISAKYFQNKPAESSKDIFYMVNGKNEDDINKNYFITRPYDYNIYKFTPPNIFLSFRIIFPAKNSLPKDFIDNSIYKGRENRQKYIDKNKGVTYGVGNVHAIGNNLYFKTASWGFEMNDKNAFIYNTKTGETILANKIEPDEKSFFLPINDTGKGYDFSNNGFLLTQNDFLYTSYSSLAMFGFKEESANKNAKYNEVLSTYFKTQNKKSNPIIVQLKPKKD